MQRVARGSTVGSQLCQMQRMRGTHKRQRPGHHTAKGAAAEGAAASALASGRGRAFQMVARKLVPHKKYASRRFPCGTLCPQSPADNDTAVGTAGRNSRRMAGSARQLAGEQDRRESAESARAIFFRFFSDKSGYYTVRGIRYGPSASGQGGNCARRQRTYQMRLMVQPRAAAHLRRNSRGQMHAGWGDAPKATR